VTAVAVIAVPGVALTAFAGDRGKNRLRQHRYGPDIDVWTINPDGSDPLNLTVDRRHPANVILSHAPGCRPDGCRPCCALAFVDAAADHGRRRSPSARPASRLFYCPKVSRPERDAGCERLPRRALDLFPNADRPGRRPAPAGNPHPTVKPLALMRWLVGLACPPGGLVLDPFCGSGSTGAAALLEGRRFLGIELDPGYARIARARIAYWGGVHANVCRRSSGQQVAAGTGGRQHRSGREKGARA
jgi:hypothetical protein